MIVDRPAFCRHDGPAVAEYENTPIYEGWTVNRDYTGAHEFDRNLYRPDRQGSGYGCSSPTWRVEFVDSKAMALRIVAASDAIGEALAARGVLHARLSITAVSATDLRVVEYDFRKFEFMLVGV